MLFFQKLRLRKHFSTGRSGFGKGDWVWNSSGTAAIWNVRRAIGLKMIE